MISVSYGARWPIKFEPFPTEEVPELYDELITFVGVRINIDTWCAMDDVKRCRLIEKLTIEFCKETSPKKTYGVGQAMVRGGIIDALDIYGGGGGQWLNKYGSYPSNPSSIRFITARRSPRSSYVGSRQ